jgi:site-specific DNA recombinase
MAPTNEMISPSVRHRKAIAMWRVSSREQREGFSIDAQKRAGIKWANGHALEIVLEREAVETAKDDGRAIYQDILKYWGSHPEVDILLVEKVDRLSRNKKEYNQAKDYVFSNAGKEIHLFRSGRILHRDSPAADWLFTDIEEDFAAHYSLNLSQEVKKGLNEKASQGIYPTTAPFAYLNDKASKNIVPDPQRKDIFVKMANLYAEGHHSLDYIVDRAYREGLRSRRGNRVVRNSWWLYFQNPVYAGKFYWGGELHSGSYAPLWTWATHLALQKALHRDGKPRGRKWGEKDALAFRGLGVCSSPICPNPGRVLTGDGPKKNNENFIYYHCTTHSKPSIRQDRLAILLGDSLKKLEFPPDILEFVRQELHTSHESDRIQHAQAIATH